jgi:hypothetical protein
LHTSTADATEIPYGTVTESDGRVTEEGADGLDEEQPTTVAIARRRIETVAQFFVGVIWI